MYLQIPASNTTVYMLHDHFVLLQKCLLAFHVHILSLSAYILEMHISSQKNKWETIDLKGVQSTVGTFSWYPHWQELVIAGVYFRQMSEIYFSLACPYYKGVQRAKKVMSNSLGLVIFALNLPYGQVLFFWNSNYRRIVINPSNQKSFWG